MTGQTPKVRIAKRAIYAGAALLALAAGSQLVSADSPLDAATASTPVRLAQATTAPKPAGKAAFDATQTEAIHDIIKSYLLKNPELMLEIQTALEAKLEQQRQDKLKIALQSNADEIFRSKTAPVAGNPAGDVPVVEFFDYNCGYCKRAFDDLAKLVSQDPKIKLVLKELPILSKGSEEAARVALAAGLQGKYWPVHRALIAMRGEANEKTALRAAERTGAGIDMAKLQRDMNSDAVNGEIARVRLLAQKMGIQGTPHFLIGDRAIGGAPGNLLDQIKVHAAELRKDGCSVC